jgi:hypothetical protein
MSLSDPGAVIVRLAEIENDLALKQNELEAAAMDYFRAKRDKELAWAEAFIAATEGTNDHRKATATIATSHLGLEAEAKYEGLKAVVRVLSDRASIGQSILRAQGRS